ncbi:hypothetical protein Tco_0566498 [Tanacetum coccineum]
MPPILSLPLSMPCDDCDGCVTIGGSSKVICGGLIMQKIHGLSLFEGDDDNCLFTVLGLPTPASWQGDHTQIVVAAMAGVWHENGKLHEIAVDEKDKRDKYIKFLFELSEYPEAFEGLQMETASMCNVTIYYVMAVTPTRLYSFTGIGTPEVLLEIKTNAKYDTDTPRYLAFDISMRRSSVEQVNKSFFQMSLIRMTNLNEKEVQFSTLGHKICCSEYCQLDAYKPLSQSLHTGNKRLSTFNNFR